MSDSPAVTLPRSQLAPPPREDGRPCLTPVDVAARLAPYVPRVTLNWLAASSDAKHQRCKGTLLFVDVSGFTALTERLAARGKVGAEEITGVIGSVFGELLAIASAYGADLLKWGGDAVLLYFGDPDSAPRACRAAVLMSRAMTRIGRLRTSAGRVTLEVSIGAHSGGFDLYLLGKRHRELIVTGPAASVTARMEALASAGEVVVSPNTAALLDRGVLGEAKSGGVVIIGAPEADTVASLPVAPVAGLDVASLLPADTGLHLLSGIDEAEHRQATVAFLEFSGIDALTAGAGPDHVAACLDPVLTAVEDAAERYAVNFHETDIGPDGGKIVLVGGVPRVHGNDAERVLRAVHDVVAEHPRASPVKLRAGVNAGRVFVFSHDFGMAKRRIYAITGDAVNLTARVMGKSGPSQVWATEAALIKARNPFETEPVPPFRVKGKSEPVVASLVGAPRYADSEPIGDGLVFVGREAELEELLRRADAAAYSGGSLVQIIGPPGIGKSRLVSEAIDRWALSTLRVGCEEYGSATAYLPFRRIFRRLLGLADEAGPEIVEAELRRAVNELTPDLEPFIPLLADVVDVLVPSTRQVDELELRFRRVRLEQSVVQLLQAYLSAPSALVIEDVQHIDEASASLLERIALAAGGLPLLVVLTGELGGQPTPAETAAPRLVLEIEPLNGEAAVRLAGSTAATALSPTHIAAIVERADGNPLFLRELLRSAELAGGVENLPESLEPLLVAEIDRLLPSDRQILRAAAVLGSQFDRALLGEVLDSGNSIDELAWTRLRAFVAPMATGWRFAHGLMRDAAYEGLSFKRRKEMHGRAAQAIESRTPPDEAAELLSLHCLHAEHYERAWHYSRLAGDRARALWANVDAATFYGRALEAANHLRVPRSDVSAVAEALGDSCELTARYESSRRAYAKAKRLCHDDVDRVRLLRKLGVLHERQGRYQDALSSYTRGRRLLTEGSLAASAERAELDLASAGIRSRQDRYRECLRFATEAAREAERAHHRSGLAHALYLQHITSVDLGQANDDLAYRSLAIFEDLGDLVGQGNVLNNLGISAYYLGRWVPALDFYERSRDARARSGDVVGAATEENNIAEILSDQGTFEQARPLFDAAGTTWRAAGYRVGAALATSNLGRLEARAGEVARGRQLLEAALADFEEIHSPAFIAETQLRLAECQVFEGDSLSAERSLEKLLRFVRGRQGLELTEVAALRLLGTARALTELAADRREDFGAATSLLDEAIARSTALDSPYELALALAGRAVVRRLAGIGGATADRGRADEIFSELGVKLSVITWSCPGTGAPLHARQPEGVSSGSQAIGAASPTPDL